MNIPLIAASAKKVLADNQISSPFVNVFDIASAEGIAVKYRHFPLKARDVSGFYYPQEKTIYLNVDESSERQLFTVAHELGHHYLNHNPDEYGAYRRLGTYVGVKLEKEREADCFAANLLMPESMIKDELKKFPFLNGENIPLLALRFGVSPSAMRNRLKNLNLIKK